VVYRPGREHSKPRAAWQHTELPGYASELKGRAAFAWRAMDAFCEEFEPDKIAAHLDGSRLRLEPGQSVIPHGTDRELTADEFADGRQS